MRGRGLLIWALGLSALVLLSPLGLTILRGDFGAFWVFGFWALLIVLALVLHLLNRGGPDEP